MVSVKTKWLETRDNNWDCRWGIVYISDKASITTSSLSELWTKANCFFTKKNIQKIHLQTNYHVQIKEKWSKKNDKNFRTVCIWSLSYLHWVSIETAAFFFNTFNTCLPFMSAPMRKLLKIIKTHLFYKRNLLLLSFACLHTSKNWSSWQRDKNEIF